MAITVIPAPSRVLKQVSTWILMLAGVGDLAHVFLATLGDMHYVSGTTLGLINAGLVFLAGAAKMVQQNIALTADQKADMIEAVKAAPDKGVPADPPPTESPPA